MLKKIAIFFGVTIVAGAFLFFIVGIFSTSLEVHCDLQEDQYYTCQARNTLLGITLSEVKAEQVYEIEQDLTCKGAGSNKGCSAHAEFKTAAGGPIILSRLYTDPTQVEKAVNAIKSLMADKSTPIDMIFPPSTSTSILMISIVSCVFILLILIALVAVFGKDAKDLESRAIDLRKS